MDMLRQILETHYGLQPCEVVPMERGYTNRSFLVIAKGTSFVLRRGWQGKPAEQAKREELVLDWLARHPVEFGVPKVFRTVNGMSHVRTKDGCTYHLYSKVPGEVLYSWKSRCSDAHLGEVLQALCALHRLLRPLSVNSARAPLVHFEKQLAELEAMTSPESIDATPTIRGLLNECMPEFLVRARDIIAKARLHASAQEPLYWCHGDVQLENVLFAGDSLVGLVDFDTVRAMPLAMDTAFTLFSITRDGAWDEGFRWDRARWQRGAELYEEEVTSPLIDLEWSELFCLDQALLHLRAGLNSVWQLDQGIGFAGAFRGVLAA